MGAVTETTRSNGGLPASRRGPDVHSVAADPLFADPKHGDFSLPPDSPAFKIGFEPFPRTTPGSSPRSGIIDSFTQKAR
jgi:hypothetical protein